VNTHRVPFGFSYFHPNGLSGALRTTYVQQDGVFEDMSGLRIMTPGATDFWLLDATVSYRLPKRHGFVSLGVTNLTDEHFRYFETDRNNPQFQPARAVVARITLAFP
jgi:outer membrane receptor protein involved in Fe transport